MIVRVTRTDSADGSQSRANNQNERRGQGLYNKGKAGAFGGYTPFGGSSD